MNYFDVTSLNYQVAEETFEQFETLVTELMKLLRAGIVFRVGLSTGKDSSTVMNGAIEAMRRCLENGDIEPERPVVAITVDTLLEPNNIQMYVPFAHQQIKAYCERHDINLHLELVSPPLHQQLMVLYAGAQKLFATSASGRSADCSSIFKIEVGKRAVAKIIKSMPERYRTAKWANLSGVREDESARRKNNMSKRGESGLSADMLIEQVKKDGEGFGEYRFAPIADWTTRDVINCLNHAGSMPMKKMPVGKFIPCYGNNFGLLLAIYGEGSNDVCQVGETSSCGGVARFGCQTCTLVSEDVSGREMLEYPRWGRFGDDVLRLRDYIVRCSINVSNRAFHPRATCGVTSNVYLQPNVLKATVLEYILYQAAQITVKHRRIHHEFVQQGAEHGYDNDVGVMDIQQDLTLREDVKKEYIEAYTQRLSEKPMLELFTEKHAVMLSALWSLHGVKSAPYRPMAILDNVIKGHRKPLPPLNSELNAQRAALGLPKWDDASVLDKELPDALVYQLFSPCKPFDPSIDTVEELSHWMPMSFTGQSSQRTSKMLRDLEGGLIHRDRLLPSNAMTLKVKYSMDGMTDKLAVHKASSSVKLNLKEGGEAYVELLQMAKEKLQSELSKVSLKHNTTNDVILDTLIKEHGSFEIEFHAELPYSKEFTSAFYGVTEEARTRKATGVRFTKRKRIKQKGGSFKASRTSLQDYNPSADPLLAAQYQSSVSYWLPDSRECRTLKLSLHDYDMDEDFVHHLSVSMDFLDSKFESFMNKHWAIAIARHDDYVRSGFKTRLGARKYAGTGAFHSLMKHSGLNMAPRFQDYVNRSLVRTEMFHASHLFNLSDRDYQQVLNAGHVISMTEHRRQKANQLLAIRRARNIKRKELQSVLRSDRQSFTAKTVSHRLVEFLSHYEEQAFANAIFASHRGLANKQRPSLKASVNQMWMDEFGVLVVNFEKLLKLLTSANEMASLKADFQGMQSVFKVYQNKVSMVIESLQRRTHHVIDCLVDVQQTSDLIDDGMGNVEFRNPEEVAPVVDAYLAVGATRNRFLTETGLCNVLGTAKGVIGTEKNRAASHYASAIANLHTSIQSTVSDLQSVDYDMAIRKAVTLECRASAIKGLSQAKKDRLAALRAL